MTRGLIAGGEAPDGTAAALEEYQQALIAKADFPETQIAIAGTALTFRNFAAAENAYAEAVRMDPQMVDAWQMIALIRAAGGDLAGAAEAVSIGLAANPGNAPLTQMQAQLREALGARRSVGGRRSDSSRPAKEPIHGRT